MLVSVFGVWLVAANITWLEQETRACGVKFSTSGYSVSRTVKYIDAPCDEVAAEINRQIKASK